MTDHAAARMLRPVLAASLATASLSGFGQVARADGVHIHVGGAIHAHAHVHIGVPVPYAYGGPRVVVRPYYRPSYGYWGIRFAAPPPPPPTCYYECAPAVSAYYTEPAPAPAAVATVAEVGPVPEPEPVVPVFGLGVFAGGADIEGRDSGRELGLTGRLRLTTHLRLEGEVSKTEIDDSLRVERRLGGGLLWDFAPYARFAPYLVGALGVGRTEMDGGSFGADQAYGEVGLGLEWRLAPHLALIGDLRAGAQSNRYDDQTYVPLASSDARVEDREGYTRARLGALLYF